MSDRAVFVHTVRLCFVAYQLTWAGLGMFFGCLKLWFASVAAVLVIAGLQLLKPDAIEDDEPVTDYRVPAQFSHPRYYAPAKRGRRLP